jgi:hypothetical protein
MDGETDRPSLSSSRRTFSCFIQGPFLTAFPFAVALPNYQVIHWWEIVIVLDFHEARPYVCRSIARALRVRAAYGRGTPLPQFSHYTLTSITTFPPTNHIPHYRVGKSSAVALLGPGSARTPSLSMKNAFNVLPRERL